MKKEPAVTVGMITAAATAVLALLAVFGLDLDTKTQAALLGVVAAVAPLVAAFITRGKVTPVAPAVRAARRRSQAGRTTLGLLLVVVIVGALLALFAPAQANRDTNWPCAGCVTTNR